MPLRSYYIIALILLLPATTILAQDKFGNNINLHSSAMYVAHKHPYFNIVDIKGISYQRKIAGNWYAGITYSKWRGVSDNGAYVGEISVRWRYHLFDVFSTYKLNLAPKDRLGVSLGMFYARGEDVYITSTFSAGGEDYSTTATRSATYLGIAPQLSYDHLLFKNRLNVGLDIKYRNYFGTELTELDYGVHLGVNF